MKRLIGLPTALVTTLLLMLGGYSTAQAEGFYFGGGIYGSTAEVNSSTEADETAGFLIGYNLIDSNIFIFGVEVGAYDLGDFENDNVEAEASAITLGATATLPLGPFIELYGKVGAAEVSVELDNEDFDGTETYYGAGIAFDIFDTVDIYLEYLEFDTEVDSASVGVGIRLDLF